MINKDNYFEKIKSINFSDLPQALKNGHKLTEGAAKNNWSAYKTNENISRVVDSYMEKLEQWLKKNKPEKIKKEEVPTGQKVKKKQQVQKEKAKKPEKKQVEKKEKPVKAKQEKKAATKAKSVKTKTKSKPKPEDKSVKVEKVKAEVSFIKRYVGLHDKNKTKNEILLLINNLQRAITEKRIRMTSPYAQEIENIQEQLVRCYNSMGETIHVSIDADTLEHYREIAGSEKTMLSITYIKQYIGIHGRKGVQEKAQALLTKIENAIASEKIVKNDAYYKEISVIKKSLSDFLNKKIEKPIVNNATLNGLMGIANHNCKKKVRTKTKKRITRKKKSRKKRK